MNSTKTVALVILVILVCAGVSHAELGEKPPKKAIVLFDGTDVSQWTAGNKPVGWKIDDDVLEVVPRTGSITTRRQWRDFRMHIEFNVPYMPDAKGQGRGNSGSD